MTGDWGEALLFSAPRKSIAKPPSELSGHERQILPRPERVRAEAGSSGVRFFTPPATFAPLSSNLLLSFSPALLFFLPFLPPPFLFSSLSPFLPLFSLLPHHILNFYSLVLFFSFLHWGFICMFSVLALDTGRTGSMLWYHIGYLTHRACEVLCASVSSH